VTTTGTVSVADGGITSGMVANGAIGLSQIDTSQVQARVAAVCPAWQYLRGINADGTILCESLYSNAITTVDDPANVVGWFASMAIGADGRPVISYHDYDASALKVAHCGNAACSSGNTITTVDDPENRVGEYTSIAIGADGVPVISYMDWTNYDLKVAHCGDVACSTATTTTADSAGDMGWLTSIAVGTDGLPVISYWASSYQLKVAHCGNAACTSGNTITTIGSASVDTICIDVGADGLSTKTTTL
jgi:hypothetical protein